MVSSSSVEKLLEEEETRVSVSSGEKLLEEETRVSVSAEDVLMRLCLSSGARFFRRRRFL